MQFMNWTKKETTLSNCTNYFVFKYVVILHYIVNGNNKCIPNAPNPSRTIHVWSSMRYTSKTLRQNTTWFENIIHISLYPALFLASTHAHMYKELVTRNCIVLLQFWASSVWNNVRNAVLFACLSRGNWTCVLTERVCTNTCPAGFDRDPNTCQCGT